MPYDGMLKDLETRFDRLEARVKELEGRTIPIPECPQCGDPLPVPRGFCRKCAMPTRLEHRRMEADLSEHQSSR